MINITPVKVTEPSPNNGEVVLSVEGVSKKFCRDLKRSLFYGVQDIAGDLTGAKKKRDRLRTKEFWALDNVSFELRRGEALGLVGKNGSGKSTLLRIIAGLIKPDLGTVKVTGRVAPLIALGAGFNPILTGRENIYANMSILGLSTKEIDERFDDVVEFAEIGDAIDAPVQTYSSGMAARLGFASAIHTEPDILLIDEVLAVGDVKFRDKCFRKLAELRDRDTSFVLVSHNSHEIFCACESAIYMSNGQVIDVGSVDRVMRTYEGDLFSKKTENKKNYLTIPEKTQNTNTDLNILFVGFKNCHNVLIQSMYCGDKVAFYLICRASKSIENINLTLVIRDTTSGDNLVLILSSDVDEIALEVSQGLNEIQLEMPFLGLKAGAYVAEIKIRRGSLFVLDELAKFNFIVDSKKSMNRCIYYQPRAWISKSIDEKDYK